MWPAVSGLLVGVFGLHTGTWIGTQNPKGRERRLRSWRAAGDRGPIMVPTPEQLMVPTPE